MSTDIKVRSWLMVDSPGLPWYVSVGICFPVAVVNGVSF